MNDRYPRSGFDPVEVSRSTMLPTFTSPSQAAVRLAALGEAQRGSMSVNGTGFLRDEREERLQRAGYLLVVYVDSLFRTSAALVLAVCRWAKKQADALVQAVARRASRAGS